MTYEERCKVSINEKKRKANTFFEELAARLQETHSVVKSPYSDDCYIIPNGTENELSMTSKPDGSFRVSDHWNWHTKIEYCPDEYYIQCFTMDLPETRKRHRSNPQEKTKPVKGIMVAYYDAVADEYFSIYGEKYDRMSKEWYWNEPTVDEAIRLAGSIAKFHC